MSTATKINLSFLLNCPEGRELYTPICGKVTLNSFKIFSSFPLSVKGPVCNLCFSAEGTYMSEGECLIFPSPDSRNWKKWQKFLLKEGDYIITRTGEIYQIKTIEGDNIYVLSREIITWKLSISDIKGWASKDQISEFQIALSNKRTEIPAILTSKMQLQDNWTIIRSKLSSKIKDKFTNAFTLDDLDKIISELMASLGTEKNS